MDGRELEVLQVSTMDIMGGAERIAVSLHEEYLARGIDSWLAVGTKHSADPRVLEIPNESARSAWARPLHALGSHLPPPPQRGMARILGRTLRTLAEPGRVIRRTRGLEDFEYPGTRQLLAMPPRRPDVLHCHNLHGDYFDLRSLPWLSREVPTLLTLHDAWAFAGGCAHSLECDLWTTGCADCPDFETRQADRRNAAEENWKRKRDIFRLSSLFVATPSQWLMDKMERSFLAESVIGRRVIPNGVDTDFFKPGDKAAARSAIGLPHNATILLFAGKTIKANPWKDYATLRDSLSRVTLEMEDGELLLLALGEEAEPERVGRARIEFVPFQQNVADVARYYQAADVYIHATRADTFPNTILEAMACGLPVIATAVGGIPEQVLDGETGYLVPPGDAQAMAERLQALLGDPALRSSMSEAAAKLTDSRFSLCRCADQYLSFYDEMLSATESGDMS